MGVGTGLARRSRRSLLGVLAVALTALVAVTAWLLVRPGDSRPAGDGGPPDARGSVAPATPSRSATAGPAQAPAPTGDAPAGSPTAASTAASPGSLQTVPYAEVTPRPAIPLSATADFGTGLTVAISQIESVRSKAERPGEISAPAVRLTLRAHNASGRPITIEGMVVTLEYGRKRTPAISVHEPGGVPFAGVLAPGSSARGVYVFNVPHDARDQIRVITSYTGAAPTLVLAGSVA